MKIQDYLRSLARAVPPCAQTEPRP